MEKKPSEQWKDYLHEKKSLDKAADESFDLYIKKYAKEDTAHNPRKEKITEKFFTPGKIYSFLYVTQDRPNSKRPVIDRRPVIISLGQMVSEANNKVYEIGVDLMLVPPKVRIFILDQLYKIYKKDINENQKEINEGRKGKKALKLNYDISKKIFDNLGWQMAFSVFEKGNVARPAVYDYEDWVSVIPLYTRGLTGKQPKEVYSEYIKRMTNPPEVNLSEKLKTNADRKKDEVKKQQKEFRESQGGA
jgi:hypothetical protein